MWGLNYSVQVQSPQIFDRVSQLVQSFVPAIACFLAGSIALNISQSKTEYKINSPNESLKRDAAKERRAP